MIHRVHINEHTIPDKRLGRHVEHDPRSKDHKFGIVASPSQLKSVRHRRWGSIFDQGHYWDEAAQMWISLGSCTGNAAAGACNCRPLHVPRLLGGKVLKEDDAVSIYKRATVIDGFPGEYPPDDTGSSGLAAAKALVERGLIKEYTHAFTLIEALTALQTRPVLTGVNWYEGFDIARSDRTPVVIAGQIRGGHEFLVRGFETAPSFNDSIVECDNSWSDGWGNKGRFYMTVATWQTLLNQDGDVTILGKFNG